MCEDHEIEKRDYYMEKAEALLDQYSTRLIDIESSRILSAPTREQCKDFVVRKLIEANGSMTCKDLESKSTEEGYSVRTLIRAKESLRKEKKIKYVPIGSARCGNRCWFVKLCDS